MAALAPGHALDVGCGEGAEHDLAGGRRMDGDRRRRVPGRASPRARAAADEAGVVVEWIGGDALTTPLPAGAFDLVSIQYPALPKATGEAAVRALLDTVRPGGVVLAVYHDIDDEHRELMAAKGFDPADYVGADDLRTLLGDAADFAVELDEIAPRPDPPSGNLHVADEVLRARRR